MTFALTPASPFIDDVSTLNATTANAWRTYISRAVDGAYGGTYALGENIIFIGNNGIVLPYLQLSGTAKPQLASRSITRVCDLIIPFLENTSQWTSLGGGAVQSSALSAGLTLPIHVPNGATITQIEALVDNPNHGGSWPPSTPTRLELYKSDGSGTAMVGSAFSDPTTSQVIYESLHWVIWSGLSVTVNRTIENYKVRVVGEGGTNALTGVIVHPIIRVIYTTTEIDED